MRTTPVDGGDGTRSGWGSAGHPHDDTTLGKPPALSRGSGGGLTADAKL